MWFGDARCLYFSDIPNNRIMRWCEDTGAVSVYRSPSNFSNGHTRDRQGRLISCEHGERRVTRTELDGTITVLMDRFDGKRLNAPNDVVVHPDGHVWFTDPGYGILTDYEGARSPFELPTRVYRLDPATGQAEVMIEDLTRPNGLCFSPGLDKLYVVDTGYTDDPAHHRNILVYDVVGGSRLANGRAFCDMSPAPATAYAAMSRAISGRPRALAAKDRTASGSSRRTGRTSAASICRKCARISASAG